MQRQYWHKTLAGAPSKPSIKTDFELSAGLTSPGKYVRVTVPTELTQGLESLALACGATLFTVAMAAWQVRRLLRLLPWFILCSAWRPSPHRKPSDTRVCAKVSWEPLAYISGTQEGFAS